MRATDALSTATGRSRNGTVYSYYKCIQGDEMGSAMRRWHQLRQPEDFSTGRRKACSRGTARSTPEARARDVDSGRA